MTQETRVFVLPPAVAVDLERRLRDGVPHAEWRRVPHARFSLKADGVVVTCYSSGKLVVQGAGLTAFADRWLADARPDAKKPAARSAAGAMTLETPSIGSDEAGKGDYFGPLVVAAVHATPDDVGWLRDAGVMDSKRLTDPRAHQLAALVRDRLDHEVVAVEPADYNARIAATGNLNLVLAALHAEVLAALAGRHADVRTAVVDRFGNERLVRDALRERDVRFPELVQVPRAEAHPAVAAASVLARAAFLDGLAACAEACGSDLHKGAGSPVDRAARRVVQIGGRALLSTVAKMHFKNSQRLPPDPPHLHGGGGDA